jgi:hypothetical protein
MSLSAAAEPITTVYAPVNPSCSLLAAAAISPASTQISATTPFEILIKSSQLHFGKDDAVGLFNKLGIFFGFRITSHATHAHSAICIKTRSFDSFG